MSSEKLYPNTITDGYCIHHLSVIQNNINRLESNSALIKLWCMITIAFMHKFNIDSLTTISFATLLMCTSDVYYLSLADYSRLLYSNFLKKYHNNDLVVKDFILDNKITIKSLLKSFFSFLVLPYYSTIYAVLLAIKITFVDSSL